MHIERVLGSWDIGIVDDGMSGVFCSFLHLFLVRLPS